MLARFLITLAVGLVFTLPAAAQADKPDPAAAMRKVLSETKVGLKAAEIDDVPLFEVLKKVSEKHKVAFVILEEEFQKKGIENVKDKKSSREKLELKEMTLDRFLEIWLPGLRATHNVRPDYVEIVPLIAARIEKTEDPFADLLQKLHTEEVLIEGSVSDIPLFELLQKLSARHKVNFVINEECFKTTGVNDIKDAKPVIAATQLRGLTVHDFVTKILNSVGATYMLKGKTVEIVPPSYAARAAKSFVVENEDGRKSLAVPLVSAIIKEKPLSEAVALIAERYDLTAIVSPQAGDAKAGIVTARLLNVPADEAFELLAVQSNLRVVRKGTAFLITSREHADNLFNEQIEKERAKIDLEKFRNAPLPKPEKR